MPGSNRLSEYVEMIRRCFVGREMTVAIPHSDKAISTDLDRFMHDTCNLILEAAAVL